MVEGDIGREDRTGTGRRLSVQEAASELGTTSEGIRSRLKRGTLQAEREGGRVWVILETRPNSDRTRTDPDQPGDRAEDRAVLVDELRARVDSLERQLDLERDANRENRRLLAAALERIPALEPPGDAETPSETPPSSTGPPEAETGVEGRPWWRRMFGG